MKTLKITRGRIGRSLSALLIGGVVVFAAGCGSDSDDEILVPTPHGQASGSEEQVGDAPLGVSDIAPTRFEDRTFVLTSFKPDSAIIAVSDRAGNIEEADVTVGSTGTALGVTFELETVSPAGKSRSDGLGGDANVAFIRVQSVAVPTHLPGYSVSAGDEITASGANPGLAWPIWFEFASNGPNDFKLVARNTEDINKSSATDLVAGNRFEQAGGEFEIIEVSGTDGPLIDVSAVIRVITPPRA